MKLTSVLVICVNVCYIQYVSWESVHSQIICRILLKINLFVGINLSSVNTVMSIRYWETIVAIITVILIKAILRNKSKEMYEWLIVNVGGTVWWPCGTWPRKTIVCSVEWSHVRSIKYIWRSLQNRSEYNHLLSFT